MIADEGLSGQIVAEIDEQGLAIQIQDQIVFPSGVAQLSDEGRRIVGRISGLVHKHPEHYRELVEGHTDDVPIATAQFPSNWELSAARALEVRDALARGGFPDGRLSISAYASTRPLAASNGEPIEVVRQKNRRVVIRVY
jgi:chemotaxis protein MotB